MNNSEKFVNFVGRNPFWASLIINLIGFSTIKLFNHGDISFPVGINISDSSLILKSSKLLVAGLIPETYTILVYLSATSEKNLKGYSKIALGAIIAIVPFVIFK